MRERNMDSNEIAAYYDQSCRDSQYGWQASFLFSEDDQYVRFATVNSIIAPNSSVLDVGCGQGDFCPFAKTKNLLYTGLDISGEMIQKAKQKFPMANFVQWDFVSNPIEEKFDYVMALGTFSLKVENQYEYIEKALIQCFVNCKKAVAATILTTVSDVKYESDESKLFYYDPAKLFAIASNITPYLIFNTATLPCEVTLYMYRF